MRVEDGIPVSWAARRAERSEAWVRKEADAGRLVSLKTRLGRLIDPADLERLLLARGKPQDA